MTLNFQKERFPVIDQAEVKQLKAQLLVDADSNPSWLAEFRQAESDAFAKQALPHRKLEHWKYNDVYFLTDKAYQLDTFSHQDEAILAQARAKIKQLSTELKANMFIFIDGHWVESLSTNTNQEIINATPFNQANAEQSLFIQQQLKFNQQTKNSFVQLNNAVCSDGLLIEIKQRKSLEQPIVIVQFKTQAKVNQISSAQILVKAEQATQFQLADYAISLDLDATQNVQALHLALSQTQIYLAASSRCQYYRVQAESKEACQIGRCVIGLHCQANLEAFFYAEGSQINKLDLDVLHLGEHSKSYLTGVYLPRNEQKVDFHTNLEHRVANCQSREVFRGIMADASTATFSGKIHIFQDAQKTDAQLKNKNLLLTNQATINSKPELEIYADDVVCAHGATVAKIDPQAIYYLQTRGIGQTRAKKMLSVGFIQELIEQMPETAIRQDITQRAQACLSDIQ